MQVRSLLLNLLQLGVQFPERFSEGCQSFGEQLGCGFSVVLATSRNLLPAVAAQGAALLMG